MITGKTAILAYFDQSAKPYFAIFQKGKVEKGQAIYRNDKDDKDFDFSSGKQLFDQTLQLLGYGDYTLVIDATKNVTNRGSFTVDFRIGLEDNQPAPAIAVPSIGSVGHVTTAEMEALIEKGATKRFKELMDAEKLKNAEEKIKELEKENKELQKSSADPINKFIGALSPHAPAIIAGLTGQPVQAPVTLSGVNPDAIGSGSPENQKVVEEFVVALADAKPSEWQSILQKLTTLIKNEPAKFEMALNLL